MIKHLVCLLVSFVSVQLFSLEPYDQKSQGFQIVQNSASESDSLVSPVTSTNEQIASVKMITEDSVIVPGKPLWVAFQFTLSDGWHLYWKNPGDAGQGPVISWTLPAGFTAKDPLWPTPERIEIDQSVIFGYSKKLVLLAQIVAPENLEVGSYVDIKAQVDWYGCNTVCVPGESLFATKLAVAKEKQAPTKQVAQLFKQARNALPLSANNTKVQLQNGMLEIRVHQDIPFGAIKSVYFFADEPEVLDTKATPKWQLSTDKKTLTVQVATPKALKGVVAVEEESPLGPLKSAWNVSSQKVKNSAPASKFEMKYNHSVDEHLEALENQVWYRKLLTELSLFMKSEFAKILLWAFLGGMILNVMPCVLPVISMKILHFVQLKDYSRASLAKHGLMYSFGVLMSFWLLSGAIYLLQSFGHVIGWGFQLQEPLFVTFLIIVLFILALSLFGVFEFGLSLSSATGSWEQSHLRTNNVPSYTSSFASGVLATFVAAPCTGPLLGSAVGFAATLQPAYSFAIFSVLGLGMAFPFLLLSFFPVLIRFLPAPGRWMVTFKQLMGFLMLATVLWLIWVLDAQTTALSNLFMLTSLFLIAIGAWVYGTWCSLERPKRTRMIGLVIALIFVAAGSGLLISNVQKARGGPSTEIASSDWEVFSEQRLNELVKKGTPVFVDVTAKWCLTCQTNHVVLESDKVKAALKEYGYVKMKADWTKNDEAITRYMRTLGRNGVPVYVVYNHGKVQVLPELLTPDLVIEALK
ncbi:MAG: thioredoxin family protein [Verrucomicrobia bacterium]|nr:thioredoxin family protein [Verrucomicrobiota bacterium]MBS0636045.1 thioredoxin family protein [Verrucomicrobiota bacterium]